MGVALLERLGPKVFIRLTRVLFGVRVSERGGRIGNSVRLNRPIDGDIYMWAQAITFWIKLFVSGMICVPLYIVLYAVLLDGKNPFDESDDKHE
jgi:hypothetical protein